MKNTLTLAAVFALGLFLGAILDALSGREGMIVMTDEHYEWLAHRCDAIRPMTTEELAHMHECPEGMTCLEIGELRFE